MASVGWKLPWPMVNGQGDRRLGALERDVAGRGKRGACQTDGETQRDLEAEGDSGLVHCEEVA